MLPRNMATKEESGVLQSLRVTASNGERQISISFVPCTGGPHGHVNLAAAIVVTVQYVPKTTKPPLSAPWVM